MSVRSKMGDRGFTYLLDRVEVRKDSPYICVLGEIDELNACLGMVKAKTSNASEKKLLTQMQKENVFVSSVIATAPARRSAVQKRKCAAAAKTVEKRVSSLEKRLAPVRTFQYSGNSEYNAFYDLARALARRAERSVVGLMDHEGEDCLCFVKYFNVLSDHLFLMGRQ